MTSISLGQKPLLSTIFSATAFFLWQTLSYYSISFNVTFYPFQSTSLTSLFNFVFIFFAYFNYFEK